MKKLTCLVLLLCLTACSAVSTPTKPFEPALAAQLTEANVFSEPLEPLDADLIWILYSLEQSGANREDLTDAVGYCSTGATCEQVVVLCFSQKASATSARESLSSYLEGQIQANRNYRPAEVPKLEKAILSQRDNTVLLLVANDYDAAGRLIDN